MSDTHHPSESKKRRHGGVDRMSDSQATRALEPSEGDDSAGADALGPFIEVVFSFWRCSMAKNWSEARDEVETMIGRALEEYEAIVRRDVDRIGGDLWEAHRRIGEGIDDGREWWDELTPTMRQDVLAFAAVGLAVLHERLLREQYERED